MACSSTWDKESKVPEGIAGDRRVDRRYPIQLDLRWKLIHRKRVLDSGEGTTLDLSSGGVQFDSGRTLPEGFDMELSISWPVLLRNVAPMQLVVHGRVVRSKDGRIAVRMIQHDFRTVGIPAHHSGSPSKAVHPQKPFLAALTRMASFQ